MFEVFFVILFCFAWISIAFCRGYARYNREERRRQANQHRDLPTFRENQQAQRAAAAAQGDAVTPTAPTEPTGEERMQLIKRNLFHRKLEHGESVRTLANVLAVARVENENSSEQNVFSRTWRSAETSVKTFYNQKPECSICLCHYEAQETVCWSKEDDCDHIFHQDCIVTWLADHDDCPLCRAKLMNNVDHEADEENPDISESF